MTLQPAPKPARKKAGIYTKKGDRGETSLGDKTKVYKTHPRIQATGSLDELNATIGLMVSYCPWSDHIKFYHSVQSDLFVIGAIIGGCDPDLKIDSDRIAFLEEMIDEISAKLEPLNHFILPGGGSEASWCHLARTACRRAERDVVGVQTTENNLDGNVIAYLNRLSDLFFVMARKANHLGRDDILWTKESPLKGR